MTEQDRFKKFGHKNKKSNYEINEADRPTLVDRLNFSNAACSVYLQDVVPVSWPCQESGPHEPFVQSISCKGMSWMSSAE